MEPNEGKHEQARHYPRPRPPVDYRKIERLKKLARETEQLAMELVCEVYTSSGGSGHMEPPVPSDGGGVTNGIRRLIGSWSHDGNGSGSAGPNPPALGGAGGVSTHGGPGHQEPPVPVVDALVSVAHGAREICDGCDKLS